MPRAFKQRRQKATRILFSANAIPSDISIHEIAEIAFGKDKNKAAEAAKAIMNAYSMQKTSVMTQAELSKVANAGGFSRGQFYNVVHDMISIGILNRTDFGEYELSTNFSSALSRIADAYRESVRSMTKR